MPNVQARVVVVIGIGCLALCPLTAQQKGGSVTVTDRDRAEIQELVAHYARALNGCAADEYASLFAAPDGYFASGPRGHVAGREKLVALVKSERHCNDTTARRAGNAPTVVVEASGGAVTGKTISGAGGGHYEDVYVKAADGWKFKSRNFISALEETAKLTAQDFIDIRKLAGNEGGQFDDVYSTAPDGKKFRSSGVVIAPSAEGATGKVYLRNDGGHYEDVYVKSAAGWRFKSRLYVAPTAESASAQAGPR
jgi:hypothetical protein